jgi:Na+-translocating ferredoxin:NAD+ oxidoreductase RnfC subunit
VVAACPACDCTHAQNIATHAVRAALVEDDLDRALTLGLLDVAICDGCDHACTTALLGAREARVRALAARDRFRAREGRLERRRQERADRRSSMAASGNRTSTSPLPSAAAAALARAKAKAAAPR